MLINTENANFLTRVHTIIVRNGKSFTAEFSYRIRTYVRSRILKDKVNIEHFLTTLKPYKKQKKLYSSLFKMKFYQNDFPFQ